MYIACPLSGKRLLKSETDQSDVLMTSPVHIDLIGQPQLCRAGKDIWEGEG